jgi:wobble nucleotide-excising tRNase
LIYGWNGSGKSTLSNLFRCIENRSLSPDFPSAEFSVNNDVGAPITQANIAESLLNIYTFNHDFIEKNISWDSVVKSILLVDQEKISEREKLETLKNDQQIDNEAHVKEAQRISQLDTNISKFASDSARHMKSSLQSIDTNDKYYLNYDKRKFETFIDENVNDTKLEGSLLAEEKIIALTNAAKPDQKPVITFSLQKITDSIYIKAKERLDELLKTSVVSQTIKRLADNNDIKLWVETGLDLHKQHDTNRCEFCGNEITDERIKQLEAHFNDDYKAFQERLDKAEQWLSSQYIQLPNLPSASDFYDEFKAEYNQACTAFETATSNLNAEIQVWHSILKKKTDNQLETNLEVIAISESSIGNFNKTINDIETVISKHNNKTSNFLEETKKAKKTLELHYATTEIKSFDYFQKKLELTNLNKKNTELKTKIDNRASEIRTLEASLSNETLGATHFNDSLHKFLGRSELSLRFNSIKKGYEILRNETDPVNGKLSEGEKTAIAFVYFITKLKENNNKIDKTIVVIDDPISSFDSNHLFHAYSFLKSNCQLAEQLFVLTHNFTFFKLLRDWLYGINKHRKSKGKSPNAFFYTIESTICKPRNSQIKNADNSLIHYNSEYHYIFSRLYHYKDNQTLSRDEAFLTANLARKLLESFFSFKFPKHRSDISQLMSCGLNGCTVTDESIKEKIYRFINKYSHSAVIEINEDSSENLVGESINVIGDIFAWLEEVDKIHYNEMIEVVVP